MTGERDETPLERLRREFREGTRRATHGLTSTYTVYGCRCGPCTSANTAAVRRWRESQRKGEA